MGKQLSELQPWEAGEDRMLATVGPMQQEKQDWREGGLRVFLRFR